MILLVALSAHAATIDIRHDGKPFADAELCWFKAFAQPKITCGAKMPDGAWSVFARHAPDLVSDRVVLADSNDPRSITLNLVRARAADDVGDGKFAYVTATGSAYPLTGNALVPADAKTITIAVVNGKIVSASGANVIVPVTFSTVPNGKIAAPRVTIGDRKPIDPLPLLGTRESTLVFFRDVPDGAATVTLTGDRWKTVETKLAVKGTTVAEKALAATASSKLTLHWWTAVDLAKLGPPDRACGKAPPKPDDAKGFHVELLRCIDDSRRKCTTVEEQRELPLDAMRGSVEFPDVASGAYLAAFVHERLPRFFAPIDVKNEAASSADVEIRYLTFFGRVTRSQKPLHVRVFDSVTDPETGQYVAVVRRLPTTGAPMTIEFCDGGDPFWFVPERDVVENAAYDIELPENRVVVDVVDRETRAPIDHARVSQSAAMAKGSDAAYFAGMGGPTDEKGRYVFEPIENKKEITICATRKDYESACADRFVMGDDHERHIELALHKVKVHQGQIMLGGDMMGRIDWHTRDGALTERITVPPDGKFTFKKDHAEGEVVTYGSRSQPFIVMLQPRLGDDDVLRIAPPSGARLRTFDVALSPGSHEETAFLSLIVGDIPVPENALLFHMMMHGQQATIRPGASTTVIDILESAPLRVMLIPMNALRARGNDQRELAMRPDLNQSFAKIELGERTRVEFP